MRLAHWLLALGALAAAIHVDAPAAFAQHFDVLVQDVGQRLGTGAADFDAGEQGLGTRVFPAALGSFYATDDPGFNSIGAGSSSMPAGAAALPGSADLAWDFLPMKVDGYESNLLYWNGAGTMASQVAFGPTPAPGYSLTLFGKNDVGATADGSAAIVPGSVIATTAGNGFLHDHRFFFLDNDANPENPTVAAAGVYMTALRLRMEGLDASDPLFMVWGTPGVSFATIETARTWAAEHVDELSPSFAADFDGDFDVDGADFLRWQRNLGATEARQMHGDANRDRQVGAGDLMVWREQFGLSLHNYPGAASGAVLPASAVPEPATAGLAAAAMLVLLRIGRCRPVRFPLSGSTRRR